MIELGVSMLPVSAVSGLETSKVEASSAEDSVVDGIASSFTGDDRAGVGSGSGVGSSDFAGSISRRDLDGEESRLFLVGEPSRDGLFTALELALRSSLMRSWDRVRWVLYEGGGPNVESIP